LVMLADLSTAGGTARLGILSDKQL
jgi:hypothetical protein